jgi:hypothetical protein
MQKIILIGLLGLFISSVSLAQSGKIDYNLEFNDPEAASKLLVLAEMGIDGSLRGRMFVADINIGAIARYSLNEKVDIQSKIRKSIASFYFDPAYRKNFEMEGVGTFFLNNKVKQRRERVIVSEREFGNRVDTEFFEADLPQRNSFGINAGINYKTVGIDPTETYDPASGEGYNGARENVNFSTLSLIGGLQFKRVNASVIKLKNYRNPRVFDNYVVMTFDGIIAPINTFNDAITGEKVGNEIKEEGFTKSLPFGARITYNVYGSIPASDNAKLFRYTYSTSIGIRPYLGFHFDFGIGFMVLRKR